MCESQRDTSSEWPTPSFDRAGIGYECSNCGDIVKPKNGDKECALEIAAATYQLCANCAESIREELR